MRNIQSHGMIYVQIGTSRITRLGVARVDPYQKATYTGRAEAVQAPCKNFSAAAGSATRTTIMLVFGVGLSAE
mgnify:CR=1 FL=1